MKLNNSILIIVLVIAVLIVYNTIKFNNKIKENFAVCPVTFPTEIFEYVDIPPFYLPKTASGDTNIENPEYKIAKDKINIYLNALLNAYNNINCENAFITFLTNYANANGFLKDKTKYIPQGILDGFGIYVNTAIKYLIVIKRNPSLKSSVIESWLNNLFRFFINEPAPGSSNTNIITISTMTNNGFLMYYEGIVINALLTNTTNQLQSKFTILIDHINNNIRTDGFIISELNREAKTYDYHRYYLNILLGLLTLIKYTNIEFTYNKIDAKVKLAIDHFLNPNTVIYLDTYKQPLKNYKMYTQVNRPIQNDAYILSRYNHLFKGEPIVNITTTVYNVNTIYFYNIFNTTQPPPPPPPPVASSSFEPIITPPEPEPEPEPPQFVPSSSSSLLATAAPIEPDQSKKIQTDEEKKPSKVLKDPAIYNQQNTNNTAYQKILDDIYKKEPQEVGQIQSSEAPTTYETITTYIDAITDLLNKYLGLQLG